jgi:MFS family permease
MSDTPAPAAHADARRALFADRNFRWLMGGGAVSMLGDQFTLVALPWLVLMLTHDPMALGLVLALMSLPRAAFILVGGALVDRYSPRNVLLVTKTANGLLLALLAAFGASGGLQLGWLYALAPAIGLVTAFGYPASGAILPQAVAPAQLQAANGTLMGLGQLSLLVGPVLAGALIRGFGDGAATPTTTGLWIAFGCDAFSFLFSAWTLTRVRLRPKAAASNATQRHVFAEIGDALRAFWRDTALRTLCLYFAAIGFFVGGPIQVALPVLASRQLAGGAGAFGLLMAAHGAGVLAGMVLASVRPTWRLKTLGTTMLAIDAIAGLAFLPFGHIHATWQGAALLAPLGALGGFVQVAVLTWMQKRVAPEMLGRTMSLFMFIFMGLAPLAAAVAGAALRVLSPAALFTASGATLLVIVACGALWTPIRRIRDVPAEGVMPQPT